MPEQVISYPNESQGHFNQLNGLVQECLLFLLVSGASLPALFVHFSCTLFVCFATKTIPPLHPALRP